jgi:hypothetical protein
VSKEDEMHPQLEALIEALRERLYRIGAPSVTVYDADLDELVELVLGERALQAAS